MSYLITPSGIIDTDRTREHLPPEYLRMIAVFADTSSQIDLGLHCSRCGQDVQGSNVLGESRWQMECACRTFVGENPIRGN